MINNAKNGEHPRPKRFNCGRENEKNKLIHHVCLQKANCVILFIVVYPHSGLRWRYATIRIYEWFQGSAHVELPL